MIKHGYRLVCVYVYIDSNMFVVGGVGWCVYVCNVLVGVVWRVLVGVPSAGEINVSLKIKYIY